MPLGIEGVCKKSFTFANWPLREAPFAWEYLDLGRSKYGSVPSPGWSIIVLNLTGFSLPNGFNNRSNSIEKTVDRECSHNGFCPSDN